MRTVILTTDTLHHTYFVEHVSQSFDLSAVLVEARPAAVPPFETGHSFETERDDYERSKWFVGRQGVLPEVADITSFSSLNDDDAVSCLKSLRPDVVVVFGTGRLKAPIIGVCPDGFVNLHGGDPEHYRGLDSHLWAIYHKDFSGLQTTLHRVALELDDGEILERMSLPVRPGMPLSELRSVNTDVCVKLVLNALEAFQARGQFTSRAQTQIGRYYSFMPSVLKEICVKNFNKYSQSLHASPVASAG